MELRFEDLVAAHRTSAVYKMRSVDCGALALKCVCDSEENRAALAREFGIQQRLSHIIGVPKVFGVEVSVVSPLTLPEGVLKTVLVMEFFKGAPLHKMFAVFKTFPVAVVKHIVKQLCGILREVHNANVIYGDLKLPNVLICLDGAVKLVDFGSSIECGESPLCVSHFLKMTPHLRPPELTSHCNEPLENPFLVDFWCVGVLTYELLTGVPSFNESGESKGALDVAIVSDAQAKDFILLLLREPSRRLGGSGWDDVLAHEFLAGFTSSALPEEFVDEVEMQTLGL